MTLEGSIGWMPPSCPQTQAQTVGCSICSELSGYVTWGKPLTLPGFQKGTWPRYVALNLSGFQDSQ